jgi:SAM-dependent methyltransferase
MVNLLFTPTDWDHRFSQQAVWTQNLRHYIYNRIGFNQLNHIIEIGCGTGGVLADFKDGNKNIFGLDLSEDFIHLAKQKINNLHLSIGDAHALPFEDSSFDLVLCHFFLLWVSEPVLVLQEMKRIARKNSPILVLAEPDYSGRIDYPDDLKILGSIQAESLIKQGADPYIGRTIGSLLHNAGIPLVEMGIMGGQWSPHQLNELQDDEWHILSYDLNYLKGKLDYSTYKQYDLEILKNIHKETIRTGARVLFVPTYYAWGRANK